ncbi:hypothetical protein BH10PAT3_BH10PAT3_3160 [soil metagenome]
MPSRENDCKLTLSVTADTNSFLDEKSTELFITKSEYLRRLIGLGATYSAFKRSAEESGYNDMLAFAPAFPRQEGAQEVGMAIISDMLF